MIDVVVWPYGASVSMISSRCRHRADVGLDQVAVLAGDPVALDDLGGLADQLGDLAVAARGSGRTRMIGAEPRSRARPGRARRGSRGSPRRARAAEGARPRRAGTGPRGGPARRGSAGRPAGAPTAARGSCRRAHRHRRSRPNGLRIDAMIASIPSISHVHQTTSTGTSCEHMKVRGHEPPPHVYFVVSAVFHYLGPSFAVLLFARVPGARRGLAADRLGRGAVRDLAPALAGVARLNTATAAAADRLGRGAGGDELLLLRGDLRGCRWARSPRSSSCPWWRWPRSAHARPATRRAGARRGRRLCAQPRAAERRARSASPSRSPTPPCSPTYIVLAHRAARDPAIGGIDGLAAAMLIAAVVVTPMAGPAAARRSATRSRCSRASASGSAHR